MPEYDFQGSCLGPLGVFYGCDLAGLFYVVCVSLLVVVNVLLGHTVIA